MEEFQPGLGFQPGCWRIERRSIIWIRKAHILKHTSCFLFKLVFSFLYVNSRAGISARAEICPCNQPLRLFSDRLHQVLRLRLLINWNFTSLSVFILTHPVNFPVGGNRRKPTTFGRVLTNSFHMSEALGSSITLRTFSLRIEPATSEVKGERSDHFPYFSSLNTNRLNWNAKSRIFPGS